MPPLPRKMKTNTQEDCARVLFGRDKWGDPDVPFMDLSEGVAGLLCSHGFECLKGGFLASIASNHPLDCPFPVKNFFPFLIEGTF